MFSAILTEVESLGRPSGEVWFRGHADAQWTLTPRLLRSPSAIAQEKNILARFRSRAMAMLRDHPDDKDPARWLFLMQHHGLPTRLLDWTESALAGLYFAVADHDDRDGALYLLAPIDLNNHLTSEPVLYGPYTDRIHSLLMSCFKGTEKPQEILAVLAYASNDRISRQQGHFTVHGLEQDLRMIARPEYLRTIRIPAERKSQLRNQLAYFGITRTSLFNDLDSLAADLREQHGIS
jgi:hypothetical protein